jgi:hypothetical protein
MFKIVTDGGILGTAITAMKANCKEGLITFPTSEEMFMRSVDTANVCLAECSIKAVASEGYTDLGIEWEQVPADLSGVVELDVADRIQIKQGRVTTKVPLLNVQYIKKVPTPKIPFKFIFDLPSEELQLGFKEVCKVIPAKDSQDGVLITWTGSELVIENYNQDKKNVTYTKDELTIRVPCETQQRVLLPTDYVRTITTTIGRLDRCIVGLGDEMPISIGGNGSGIGLGYLISPRLIKDD